MARSGCDRDVHGVAYGRGLDGDSRDMDALLRRRLLLLCAVAQEVNAFVKTPLLRIAKKFGLILSSSRKVQPKRSGVSVERLRPLQYPEHDHEADYCLC